MAERTRTWAAEPEMGDEAVREATGRGWEQWRDLLDAWSGRERDHAAIAAHLVEEHGVEGWWAQTVAVGYERITGRRQRFQRLDGTFSANKSRTITTDADVLRERLLDVSGRAELFGGIWTELRSRPTSKNVRLAVGPGTAEIAIEPRADGRVKVVVEHARLPDADEVERWKAFWSDWLAALDDQR